MLKAFIHIKITEQHKYNSNISCGYSLSKIGIVIVSDDDKVGLMLCAK